MFRLQVRWSKSWFAKVGPNISTESLVSQETLKSLEGLMLKLKLQYFGHLM